MSEITDGPNSAYLATLERKLEEARKLIDRLYKLCAEEGNTDPMVLVDAHAFLSTLEGEKGGKEG